MQGQNLMIILAFQEYTFFMVLLVFANILLGISAVLCINKFLNNLCCLGRPVMLTNYLQVGYAKERTRLCFRLANIPL